MHQILNMFPFDFSKLLGKIIFLLSDFVALNPKFIFSFFNIYNN